MATVGTPTPAEHKPRMKASHMPRVYTVESRTRLGAINAVPQVQ